MVEREVGNTKAGAKGKQRERGIFPIKKMAADYTSLFLSNVIKPTSEFYFHQIKDNTYFWKSF